MNGEIQQVCSIAISARKALYDGGKIVFTPSRFVLSVQFQFVPRFFFCKAVTANSVSEWFQICLQRGLRDVKVIVPTNRENKHLLGFANTSRCAIICYWKNGSISCFGPVWEFDRKREGWIIRYHEQRIDKNPTIENLHFSDRTDEFKSTLLELEKFATTLEFPYFADVFHRAYEALCGCANMDEDTIPKQLPNEMKAVYFAVEKADVFGAMGSWNDSPPCYAHEKGLDREYHELSNKLLIHLRYNLMYVVNECWKKN